MPSNLNSLFTSGNIEGSLEDICYLFLIQRFRGTHRSTTTMKDPGVPWIACGERDTWVGILMSSFPISQVTLPLWALLYLQSEDTLKNYCKDYMKKSIQRGAWERLDVKISKGEKLPLCTSASLSSLCVVRVVCMGVSARVCAHIYASSYLKCSPRRTQKPQMDCTSNAV